MALLTRESAGKRYRILLHAKAEPGNIGAIQLSPTIQSTWSNIRRAHAGNARDGGILTAEAGVRIVYRAEHNEEGGRFRRKSNREHRRIS